MAEPKDIVDFETLTPAVGDYLIVQRSASVGGKATIEAVVAASKAAPYVLSWDGDDHAGSGSASTKPEVATVAIPANTVAANGGALHVNLTFYKDGTIANNELVVELNGSEVMRSNPLTFNAIDLFIVRYSSTSAHAASQPYQFGVVTNLDWSSAQSLAVKAAAGITLKMLRVVVEPG